VQAEGIKIGAEHFRRSRPETMGSIFWQLNDCWPVASWSSIDSEGRWKALQYFARRFYAPILVSPHMEDGAVKIYIVSDKTAEQAVKLHLSLMDFKGKVLLEETKDITVSPLDSKVYEDWPLTRLLAAAGKDAAGKVFVNAEIESGGKLLSQNLTYLVPTKEVSLPAAPLSATLTGSDGVYDLRVNSPVLARSVYVSFGDLDASVSENYFDLLPNRPAVLTIRSAKPLDELRARMKIISLRDAFQPEASALGAVALNK
jgi:beta-mannosidase